MTETIPPRLRDMFRRAPVQSALLIGVPLLLAFGQLGNSVANDLSFAISIPFALFILGYTGVITQYRFARFRRQELERALWRHE